MWKTQERPLFVDHFPGNHRVFHVVLLLHPRVPNSVHFRLHSHGFSRTFGGQPIMPRKLRQPCLRWQHINPRLLVVSVPQMEVSVPPNHPSRGWPWLSTETYGDDLGIHDVFRKLHLWVCQKMRRICGESKNETPSLDGLPSGYD